MLDRPVVSRKKVPHLEFVDGFSARRRFIRRIDDAEHNALLAEPYNFPLHRRFRLFGLLPNIRCKRSGRLFRCRKPIMPRLALRAGQDHHSHG
jgi:hypothetical protein